MPVITPLIQRQLYPFTRFKFLSPLAVPTTAITTVRIRKTSFLILGMASLALLGSFKAYAAPALTASYKGKFIQDCTGYISQQRGVCDCLYKSLTQKYGGEKKLAAIEQRQVPTPKNYSSDVMWGAHQCTYKK